MLPPAKVQSEQPGWTYLQHVVYDVQFDDRLSPDQVVHHGVIHVAHHEVTQDHDKPLQHVAHLSWLEQAGAAEKHTLRSDGPPLPPRGNRMQSLRVKVKLTVDLFFFVHQMPCGKSKNKISIHKLLFLSQFAAKNILFCCGSDKSNLYS